MGCSELIKKLQEQRKTKVITYITSDKPGISSMIEDSMLRELYDHLKPLKGQNIDLFLYSRGGSSVVAWGLVNLIREFAKKFCVIVPYKAHSCATAISIGADKIIMGRLAELGPVDPTISALKKGERLDVSVEDMSGYINFLKSKFEIKAEDQSIKAFEKLADEASPLTLGRSYREYIKAREDTKKLLSFAYEDKSIDKIVEILVEKLYSHFHLINRKEAKEMIGLNVEYATEDLECLMWDIFLHYEEELGFKIPYEDRTPSSGTHIDIPLAIVESEALKSVRNARQWYTPTQLPDNSKIIQINNQLGVLLPNSQVLPISPKPGSSFSDINNKIYEKREVVLWEQVKAA
jgi:hypothetical protein